MNQEIQQSTEQRYGWVEFSNAAKFVQAQAGLRLIDFNASYDIHDHKSLVRLEKQIKHCVSNQKKLMRWVATFRPKGIYLFVSRKMYYQSQLHVQACQRGLDEIRRFYSE